MRDLVFSKLSNRSDTDEFINKDNSDPQVQPVVDSTSSSTLSEATKPLLPGVKKQMNISDLFIKKTQKQAPRESIKNLIASGVTMPDTLSPQPPQNGKEPVKETAKSDSVTGDEMPNENLTITSPPANPNANSLPEEFTTAARFRDQVTHGTAQEIIFERLKFEIPLDAQTLDDSTIHTKALVILGRLVNEDPSCKVLAFKQSDENYWKPLEKTHDIPQTMESMRKYIADPILNTKTQRLVFHMRFATAKPLQMMKRNSNFMMWLKKERIWLSVNQITSTNTKRIGFFIGKNAYITHLEAFHQFVRKTLHTD